MAAAARFLRDTISDDDEILSHYSSDEEIQSPRITAEFNTFITSLVKNQLSESKIASSNFSWFFYIVFPDIPQLNGVKLLVPVSYKKWPQYTHNKIFRCINAKYPEITSPTFNGESYRLQINVEGQDVERLGPKDQTKDLQNGATVELRYQPLREPVPSIEGVYEAGAAADAGAGAGAAARLNQFADPGDNWRDGPLGEGWDEGWGDDDLVDPRDAMAAHAADARAAADAVAADARAAADAAAADAAAADARAAAVPVDPYPPILHPASLTMMTYDHKSGRYVEPLRDPVAGGWMTWSPQDGRYWKPTPPWSGHAMTPGMATQGPPPIIYPNNGGSQTPGPYPYGGKKPQSKRGKKKSKSKSKTKKSKTKKSKSKSKRNKRRSYKR